MFLNYFNGNINFNDIFKPELISSEKKKYNVVTVTNTYNCIVINEQK